MRTPRRAAWAAVVCLAGGALSGSPAAHANHLDYVEPTEYERQHPEQVRAEAPAGQESTALADSGLSAAFAALRQCESGGDYGINTGNGYYGAYQFALSTWQGLGYGGYPHEAPPHVQDEAALALYNTSGWSPWPACSAQLGLR